jgi:hypothetical protein
LGVGRRLLKTNSDISGVRFLAPPRNVKESVLLLWEKLLLELLLRLHILL